jgi:TRAP-type mannitol/chloroaromatic compound transport system substrate-binding protein
MEILPDGAVVNAFEILDAVDKGVVDGGFAWTHYWSGKNSCGGAVLEPGCGLAAPAWIRCRTWPG